MILPPPRSTRTDTPFPSTTLFRSPLNAVKLHVGIATDIIANGKSQITGHQRRAETDGKTALLAVTHIFGRGQEIVDIGDRSEEHTSELQSLMRISYAVFCLKKKTIQKNIQTYTLNQHYINIK